MWFPHFWRANWKQLTTDFPVIDMPNCTYHCKRKKKRQPWRSLKLARGEILYQCWREASSFRKKPWTGPNWVPPPHLKNRICSVIARTEKLSNRNLHRSSRKASERFFWRAEQKLPSRKPLRGDNVCRMRGEKWMVGETKRCFGERLIQKKKSHGIYPVSGLAHFIKSRGIGNFTAWRGSIALTVRVDAGSQRVTDCFAGRNSVDGHNISRNLSTPSNQCCSPAT